MSSSLGCRVKELRDQKGWTQEELADKANLSPRQIQRIEADEPGKPRKATFRLLAKALEIEMAELEKAYRDGIAADTPQAPDIAPTNDVAVPPTPRNPAETPGSPRKEWKRISTVVACIVIVSLLILAIYTLIINPWIQSTEVKPVLISGKVLCIDNERVVGVWVSAVNGGSNFASWYKTNSNGSEIVFRYDLPNGGAYNIHVGCGGSKQDWDNTDYTENGSSTIKDHNPHYFTCQDIPLVAGHGPCYLKQ